MRMSKIPQFFSSYLVMKLPSWIEATKTHPENRAAQRELARAVTKFVHGQKQLIAEHQCGTFPGDVADLSADDIKAGF